MTLKSLLALLTLVAVASAFADAKVGSPAPDFSLPDAHGKMHSLADYKGKYVVLDWFNPECPMVAKHYGGGHMQKLQGEYSEKGVVWLSINSSAAGKEGHLTADAAQKKKDEWKMNNTSLLIDAGGSAGKAFGAKSTPHMFIINPEGIVIYNGAIDSKPTPNPADISASNNYVKLALDEALAGKPVTTATTKPYGCPVKY
jgi:peroxiredoxin